MGSTTGAGNVRPDMARLEQMCESALQAVGYELVDLEFSRAQHGWVLRVFIDHSVGDEPARRGDAPRRISHGDCRQASQQLGTCLDVDDPITVPYSLEVSSPGVYRRLRREKDFRRFVGFRVRLKLRDALDGRKSFSGELTSVAEGKLAISEGKASWVLPLDGVVKAELDEEY